MNNDFKLSFYDVRCMVRDGEFDNNMKYPSGRILPDNYIFNEDLSVKENRRMVKENNKKVLEARKEFDEQENMIRSRFEFSLLEAIEKEANISSAKAVIIFNMAYSEGHSGGYNDIVSIAEKLVNLINELSKAE